MQMSFYKTGKYYKLRSGCLVAYYCSGPLPVDVISCLILELLILGDLQFPYQEVFDEVCKLIAFMTAKRPLQVTSTETCVVAWD